jgi:uncharacterized membrane protein YtjA (UPF0391 family)
MLRLTLLFLLIAFLAAIFGFGYITGLSFEAAQVVFLVFLVLAAATFSAGVLEARSLREMW